MTAQPLKTKSFNKLVSFWLLLAFLGYGISFAISFVPQAGLIDCPECVRNNAQLSMYNALGLIVLLLFLAGGVLPFIRRRDYFFAAVLSLLGLIPLALVLLGV